jgi:uncharacterized NAD-dependent epimerase/dehydratase family protein
MSTANTLTPPYLLFLGDAPDESAVQLGAELARWRPEWCAGQARLPGCLADLGLPDITLDQAAAMGVRTVILAAQPRGASLPDGWVQYLTKALDSRFDLAASLAGRLADWPSLYSAALSNGCRLNDIGHTRHNFAPATGVRRSGKRVLTIGTDSAAAMLGTTLAIGGEMQRRGFDASFRATSPVGILIGGDGLALDGIPVDRVAGAVEALCPANEAQHWDVIEGRGALFHPGQSAASLALLHGAQPDALVLCHEPDRPHMSGLPERAPPSLRETLQLSEFMARMVNPRARVVGISLDTRKFSSASADALLRATAEEFGMPCVDPLRQSVQPLVDTLTGP